MTWKITYYNKAVAAGLEAWPEKLRAKYLFIAELIGEHGANLGKPYTDSLGEGLFEIRAKAQEGIGRAFFCMNLLRKRKELLKKNLIQQNNV